MIRSCKISTDRRVVWSLCNSRAYSKANVHNAFRYEDMLKGLLKL